MPKRSAHRRLDMPPQQQSPPQLRQDALTQLLFEVHNEIITPLGCNDATVQDALAQPVNDDLVNDNTEASLSDIVELLSCTSTTTCESDRPETQQELSDQTPTQCKHVLAFCASIPSLRIHFAAGNCED